MEIGKINQKIFYLFLQLVIQKIEEAVWEETDQLGETERGLGGFGHSGR